MNNSFARCLKRLIPLGLAASAAAVLLVPVAANATPYVVTLTQQGSNVVATGSGDFDLTGLDLWGSYILINGLLPANGYVGTGTSNVAVDAYNRLSGPASFGSGGFTSADTGTGDGVALNASELGFPVVFFPEGYVSGGALTNSSTWNNASFASLGLTPGTYVWTWGTEANQSFTLDIAGASVGVPEPASLGMFGLGVLLLGAFVERRWRTA